MLSQAFLASPWTNVSNFLLFSGFSAMTAASRTSTPDTFDIKSANLPLVALLLKTTDLGALSRELAMRFGDVPDFFDQDVMMVDLSPLDVIENLNKAPDEIDFVGLIALLRDFRLLPIAVKSANPVYLAAAVKAGLLLVPEAHLVSGKPKTILQEPLTASPVEQLAPNLISNAMNAMVIDKPLRSGQQVYARGRDLVVLAMVNAGAEVIADGHIHVYAPLRGKAMAGARGNAEARIFALNLEAELISIAGVYRTSEHPLPADVQGKPTQVRLVASPAGDRLVMDVIGV